jgi:hypothetical protein
MRCHRASGILSVRHAQLLARFPNDSIDFFRTYSKGVRDFSALFTV